MTTIQTGWTEGLTLHQARITATEAERPSFRDDGISMHRDADQWAAVICAMFDSTGGRARACAIRIERESSAAQVDESPYHHPFGLAMALAVAAESGALKTPCDRLYGWGTMDPAGRLTPTRGELLAAEYATAEGLDFVAASVPGGGSALILDSYYHALTIKALVDSLNRKEQAPAENAAEGPTVHSLDALAGQPRVLRALEIAAAGRHPLLIAGSNRATVRAASRLPAALPRPTAAERLETARNHSAAGFAWSGKLVGDRVLCAPHCSVSLGAFANASSGGECALAHNGVLVLSDLPEFSGQTIDEVATVLHDGEVRALRRGGEETAVWPARFHFAATITTSTDGTIDDSNRRAVVRRPELFEMAVRADLPETDRIDDMTAATARMHERVATAWKLGAGNGADRPAAERLAATIARLDGRTETTAADRDEAASFGIGPLLADGKRPEAGAATGGGQ